MTKIRAVEMEVRAAAGLPPTPEPGSLSQATVFEPQRFESDIVRGVGVTSDAPDPNQTYIMTADGEFVPPQLESALESEQLELESERLSAGATEDCSKQEPTYLIDSEPELTVSPPPESTPAPARPLTAPDGGPALPPELLSVGHIQPPEPQAEAPDKRWQPNRVPASPEALSAALDRKDHPEAIRIYDDLQMLGRVGETTAIQDLLVGRLMYRWKRYFDAACACKLARDKDKQGQWAGRALYLQARIMGERLGMRDESMTLLQKCIDRYPTDAFAGKSAELLRKYVAEATSTVAA